MDYPKSVPNVGLVNGKFVDENTTTGQVGSLIPAGWGTAVTDEILNVIMGGGYVPDENESGQLLQAIKEIIADNIPPEKVRTTLAEYGITDAYTKAVTYTKEEIEAKLKNLSALPVGAMVPFPRGVVPAGFLEANGDSFDALTYPDLAAYLGGNVLPDTRGEFLRGWDHGRGVNPGRAIGTLELSQNLRHVHAEVVTNSSVGDLAQFVAGSKVAAPTLTQILYNDTNATDNYTAIPADHAASGGAEARPRNLAVMWCIKVWNAPVNQGNIDIAALANDLQKQKRVGVSSDSKGLLVSASGLNGQVSIKAEQLVISSAGAVDVTGAINLVVDLTKVGPGGLDSGLVAASAFYHIFVIRGAGEPVAIASLSATEPVMPAGYTHKARVSCARTDATNKYPLKYDQDGNRISMKFAPGTNLLEYPLMASGVAGNISTPVWQAVSLANFVPPTASAVLIQIAKPDDSSSAMLAPNPNFGSLASTTTPPPVVINCPTNRCDSRMALFPVDSANMNFYYAANGASPRVRLMGWEERL